MPALHTQKYASAHERIIVALDVDSERSARSLIHELSGTVGGFKIGLQLFTSAGRTLVKWATEAGYRIFLDLKYHDIPNTVAMAGVEAARLGVWMFNVHALGGVEMMKRTVSTVSETCDRENLSKPQIIAVTILTSSNANDLCEVGIEQTVNDQVLILARLAANSGLDGVVASAHEARSIKQLTGKKSFLVVTPGIRPASGTNDDQKRVMTPSGAVSRGSDYLVIGRPINGADDKRSAVRAIVEEVETVLSKG